MDFIGLIYDLLTRKLQRSRSVLASLLLIPLTLFVGVPLCQWGARGQALEGRTCQQILSYYYPGSTVALHEKVVRR